ncbi:MULTISPECIES: DUF2087 domain-containing protein [unclassified Lysinibacillus]|uniref:DUF2087 domain-containing protein n=1 Tax=unclassified Lysinibacillus TaxID=2636778 RepID=UPI0020131C3F|nr:MULTISPECIES: DUF2087 domain-containing protein [unclassified Lysinibacillus]MCL1694616.1 DUF2087 domain-containing protein [Lysinibacillus sp. BPa_S21]MCL1699478.1 DUF2087 domain-containing protein [Lysinibacillus sp. Bpr_S20]
MSLTDLTIDELSRGYVDTGEAYECIFCKEIFDGQEVFNIEGRFFTAKKAIHLHIEKEHISVFEALLQLNKKDTGLSDIQTELLKLFATGAPDKEIINSTSANSISTIRQHRFKLKEKEKQAKVFLAIMQALETTKVYEPIHKGATQVDERFAITVDEKEKVLATYFKHGLDGPIESFPSKEKRKIILLQYIVTKFEVGRKYSEKEVNEILKPIYSDYVSIRRYLIEYGFLDRNDDCTTYWVK